MTCKSTQHRHNLRRWVLTAHGDGTLAPCAGCGVALTDETMTLDRYPIPGKWGGRYVRDNCRPTCAPCNSSHTGEPSPDWDGRGLLYRPFAELLETA